MPYDSRVHKRRSIRLPGFDYSGPGPYFITIVVHHRACAFGEIAGGEMRLNDIGQIVRDEWLKTPILRPEIELDEFVIMPDHFHAIIIITDGGGGLVGADGRPPQTTQTAANHPQLFRPPRSLGSLIAGYKSAVTTRINQRRETPAAPVWQRNYWERIIRDENELSRIRAYIRGNPMRWELDRKNGLIPAGTRVG